MRDRDRPVIIVALVAIAVLALVALNTSRGGGGAAEVQTVSPSTTTSTIAGTAPAFTAATPNVTVPAPATTAPAGVALAASSVDDEEPGSHAATEELPLAPSDEPAPVPLPRELIDDVADTGGASKVITLVSPSWSSTTATMTLWQRSGDGWVQLSGPWTTNIGYGGWAQEPGEGTGRTPVGSFTFGTGFGLGANPGYSLGWLDVTDTDYWVEDPASSAYNTHAQGPADPSAAPWGRFEHLVDHPVAYRYAALINFNVPASGPIGSGVFLHASTGGATAGCVSLPEDQLLDVLRFIDPSTRIIMAPEDTIRAL